MNLVQCPTCLDFMLATDRVCTACGRHAIYGRLVAAALEIEHLRFGLRTTEFFDALDAVADLMWLTAHTRVAARAERRSLLREVSQARWPVLED